MIKEKRKIRSNNNFFKYFIYYPSTIKENMPVLVYLHGIGERGNNLEDIEKYALPKYMNRFEIPYIVIAPQCQDNNFWDYHLRELSIGEITAVCTSPADDIVLITYRQIIGGKNQATVNWQFRTADARIKLSSLYPVLWQGRALINRQRDTTLDESVTLLLLYYYYTIPIEKQQLIA